jgi:HD-like signal output (HDOD) protein
MTVTAESIIEKAGNLATLPSIYMRLRTVIDDARSSNREVAALISEDAALAARLLQIANSSFYGFTSNIDTITRAVTVIGPKQIMNIVMATSVLDMFDGIPEERISMQGFWRASISCGVTARILATYRRAINVERFFVAGLLHDIGRLVMYQGLGEEYWDIIKYSDESGTLLHIAEKEKLGFDHCEIGGLLLKKWALPEHMVDAVRFHHRTVNSSYNCIDAAIVHVAEVISSAINAAQGDSKVSISPLDERAWNALALPVSILPPAINQLKRQYRDAVALVFPDGDEMEYDCA